MTVFGVYNIKGGVGKTASAVNLAHLSARHGKLTLVWDLDPQGAASYYLGVKPNSKGVAKKLVKGKKDLELLIRQTDYEGLDVLPSDFSFRHLDLNLKKAKHPTLRLAQLLKPLRGAYDHIYLDCPPNISLVSENVFAAADVLLIPCIPSTLSLRTFEQVKAFLQDSGTDTVQMIPFFCMVDRRKRLHREVCAALCQGQYSFLNTVIPTASTVEKMGLHKAPVHVFEPSSRAAEAYDALWQEIAAASLTA